MFELRMGRALRADAATSELTPSEIATHLIKGIEDEIHEGFAISIAELISTPESHGFEWARSSFDIDSREKMVEDEAMAAFIKQATILICVVRDSMKFDDDCQPEKAILALSTIFKIAYREAESKRKKKSKKKQSTFKGNLLACLVPAGMDDRIGKECSGLFLDTSKAQLMIYGYGLLNRAALRNGVITDAEAKKTETELARLENVLVGIK